MAYQDNESFEEWLEDFKIQDDSLLSVALSSSQILDASAKERRFEDARKEVLRRISQVGCFTEETQEELKIVVESIHDVSDVPTWKRCKAIVDAFRKRFSDVLWSHGDNSFLAPEFQGNEVSVVDKKFLTEGLDGFWGILNAGINPRNFRKASPPKKDETPTKKPKAPSVSESVSRDWHSLVLENKPPLEILTALIYRISWNHNSREVLEALLSGENASRAPGTLMNNPNLHRDGGGGFLLDDLKKLIAHINSAFKNAYGISLIYYDRALNVDALNISGISILRKNARSSAGGIKAGNTYVAPERVAPEMAPVLNLLDRAPRPVRPPKPTGEIPVAPAPMRPVQPLPEAVSLISFEPKNALALPPNIDFLGCVRILRDRLSIHQHEEKQNIRTFIGVLISKNGEVSEADLVKAPGFKNTKKGYGVNSHSLGFYQSIINRLFQEAYGFALILKHGNGFSFDKVALQAFIAQSPVDEAWVEPVKEKIPKKEESPRPWKTVTKPPQPVFAVRPAESSSFARIEGVVTENPEELKLILWSILDEALKQRFEAISFPGDKDEVRNLVGYLDQYRGESATLSEIRRDVFPGKSERVIADVVRQLNAAWYKSHKEMLVIVSGNSYVLPVVRRTQAVEVKEISPKEKKSLEQEKATKFMKFTGIAALEPAGKEFMYQLVEAYKTGTPFSYADMNEEETRLFVLSLRKWLPSINDQVKKKFKIGNFIFKVGKTLRFSLPGEYDHQSEFLELFQAFVASLDESFVSEVHQDLENKDSSESSLSPSLRELFDILHKNPGEVFSKKDLATRLGCSESAIQQRVVLIRRQIGEDAILTQWGKGFYVLAPVQESSEMGSPLLEGLVPSEQEEEVVLDPVAETPLELDALPPTESLSPQEIEVSRIRHHLDSFDLPVETLRMLDEILKNPGKVFSKKYFSGKHRLTAAQVGSQLNRFMAQYSRKFGSSFSFLTYKERRGYVFGEVPFVKVPREGDCGAGELGKKKETRLTFDDSDTTTDGFLTLEEVKGKLPSLSPKRRDLVDVFLSQEAFDLERAISLKDLQDAVGANSVGAVSGNIHFLNQDFGRKVIRSAGGGKYYLFF